MSGWQPNTLMTQVRSRLLADTGTGGLMNSSAPLVTAVWSRRFPLPRRGATDFPYVIIFPNSMPNDDAFADEGKKIGFSVEWFVEEMEGSAYDPLERVGLILERITGDWTDQSTHVPSYGLSRWTPTLQSGWSAGPMNYEDASDVSEVAGVIKWSALFSVQVNKIAT